MSRIHNQLRSVVFALAVLLALAGCAGTEPQATPGGQGSAGGGLSAVVSTALPPGATAKPQATQPAATLQAATLQAATLQAAMAKPQADVVLTLETESATLQVGQTAGLYLEEGYQWSVAITDEHVLAPLADDAQASGWRRFEALARGTTTLTVRGDPPCLQAKPPCMAPSRLVEIEITVR